MKKILLSLITVAAVAFVAVGASKAFFTDTEKSTGNTFTTGTIDIAVDGQNPWSRQTPYQLKDMKPSETDYSNFTIQNVGTNPVNVWKKLHVTSETTGVVTEPECVDQGGVWTDNGPTAPGSCDFGANTDKNDISTAINYDLSVKVFTKEGTDPIWFQTIWQDSDGHTISDVSNKNTEGNGDLLGMIPPGGRMEVTESYHMRPDTGNWAQGDIMTFDINLYAEQLTNTVTLVHKSGKDWNIIDESTAGTQNAILTYKVKDFDFKYDLNVIGLTASTNYVLVSGTNPYNGADSVQIASFTTDGSGNFSAAGQAIDLKQNLTNAKVWIILASDWNPVTKLMTGFNGSSYLFETALIDYYDTDAPL